MTAAAEPRRLRPLPTAVVWTVTALTIIAAIATPFTPALAGQETFAYLLFAGASGTFGVVGALIVTRRPDNAVGWILWVVGLVLGLYVSASGYATAGLGPDGTPVGDALPGAMWVGWFATWGFSVPFTIALLLLPLLFPDGRLPSPRWRPVLVLDLAAIVLIALPEMVRSGPIGPSASFDNPMAWRGDPVVLEILSAFSTWSPLIALPVAFLAAVTRYRKGSQIVRQQVKWFWYFIAAALGFLSLTAVLPEPYVTVVWILAVICLLMTPIAIGFAVLRYRLYEIDRVISRTISWALVSAVLVAAFGGGVLVLQAALAGVTQGQTLAVAASTLLAFALFQPLRRRIQAAVDRRFDRARYDAQRTADGFAERVRNEVDLPRISGALLATAGSAVRPVGASVWLRAGGHPLRISRRSP
jgi:MFS family permease